MADRIVQASLKLVLEPIFEADFHPSLYGFRPRRRAQDAIAEIHELTSRPADYEWVFEADIEACFDEIDHTALMGRVRERVGDKRILALIRGLSEAGVLSEDGAGREDPDRHPARWDLVSALLANIALSVLDWHFQRKWDALGPDWNLSCTGWVGWCFWLGFFVGMVPVGWLFRGTKPAVGSGG